jgi:hypothetical protein
MSSLFIGTGMRVYRLQIPPPAIFKQCDKRPLSLGAIQLHGHVRPITDIEAINGLFLIGWSVTSTHPLLTTRRRRGGERQT